MFRIGIAGEFCRGKSSLIDALIGKNIIPIEVLPSKHISTFVTFGDTPHAMIHYNEKSGRQPLELPIEQLEEYMSKISEDVSRPEKDITIYYPTDYCKNSVEILEMPGRNDNRYIDNMFLHYLPYLDIIVFIMTPSSPFSNSELNLLCNDLLPQFGNHIIFVINKMNTLKANRRELFKANFSKELKEKVIVRAADLYGIDSQEYSNAETITDSKNIHFISATDALDGLEGIENGEYVEESRKQYAESGIVEFGAALCKNIDRFKTGGMQN